MCVYTQGSNTCWLSICNQSSKWRVDRAQTHTPAHQQLDPQLHTTFHPSTCTDTLLHLPNSTSATLTQTQSQLGQLLPHPCVFSSLMPPEPQTKSDHLSVRICFSIKNIEVQSYEVQFSSVFKVQPVRLALGQASQSGA